MIATKDLEGYIMELLMTHPNLGTKDHIVIQLKRKEFFKAFGKVLKGITKKHL